MSPHVDDIYRPIMITFSKSEDNDTDFVHDTIYRKLIIQSNGVIKSKKDPRYKKVTESLFETLISN